MNWPWAAKEWMAIVQMSDRVTVWPCDRVWDRVNETVWQVTRKQMNENLKQNNKPVKWKQKSPKYDPNWFIIYPKGFDRSLKRFEYPLKQSNTL